MRFLRSLVGLMQLDNKKIISYELLVFCIVKYIIKTNRKGRNM